MRPLTTAAWVLFVALPLAADDPEPPDPKAGKQNGPLKVRLVAKKAAYELDRQGMTAKQYRDAIRDGKVAPPAVDLVLELTNTSKENVEVRIQGSVPALTFLLKGPKDGPVTYTPKATGGVKLPLKYATIKPGEKHEIAIKTLDSSAVSRPKEQTHWTEPGKYTLTVQLKTVLRGGAVGKGKAVGIAGTTLESQPVQLTVKLK